MENNNSLSDDNLWRHPSQRLFLSEFFQHLGSFGGQCFSPVNGHGVSYQSIHIFHLIIVCIVFLHLNSLHLKQIQTLQMPGRLFFLVTC